MGKSYRVLVIDDSPFIFKAVKKSLEPHGFEIVGYAENGLQGLELFEQCKPDIITLDITMPVMDGLETAAHLFKKDPSVRIIMLSAMGDNDLIQAAQDIGIKRFLSKPFKAEDLLKTVQSIL